MFGLNYAGCGDGQMELRGCVNDVRCMAATLVAAGHFANNDIQCITDDAVDGRERLTAKGIKRALVLAGRRTKTERMAF